MTDLRSTRALKQGALALASAALLGAPLAAEDTNLEAATALVPEALQAPEGAKLDDFLWTQRPVVVFADSENDPRFAQQIELLTRQSEALADRDVVVLTDTDPDALSPLRETLRPRGFMLVLIGKDGGVKLRKPFPYDVRELSRTIDKMPMRQREIRERRGS